MTSRVPRKPETFTFNGVPNQRVSDIYHALDGAYTLNWLRKALRDGCIDPAQLDAYRTRMSQAHMQMMWEKRDAYWAQVRAEKAAKAS